jgi:hypothetical protein
MILAALSQRTSKMRLGLAVVLTAVHHPLHTAERMATLNLLSGGREPIGIEELMFNFQLGPVAHDEVMESISSLRQPRHPVFPRAQWPRRVTPKMAPPPRWADWGRYGDFKFPSPHRGGR